MFLYITLVAQIWFSVALKLHIMQENMQSSYSSLHLDHYLDCKVWSLSSTDVLSK